MDQPCYACLPLDRSCDQLQMRCQRTCSVTTSSDIAFLLRMEGSSRSRDPFLPDVDGAEHDDDHLRASQRLIDLLRWPGLQDTSPSFGPTQLH